MEKLVTLTMPEHDISQDAEKPFAGESHFLSDNYLIFLSPKEDLIISRKGTKAQRFFAPLRENFYALVPVRNGKHVLKSFH